MEFKDLPKCDCGIQVGVAIYGERYWCSECFGPEIERLQAIVDKAITWRQSFGGFREGHEDLGHVATEESEDALVNAVLAEERRRQSVKAAGVERHFSLTEAEEIGLVPSRAQVERLQAFSWRDASTVDPADGDEFLVAARISDDQAEWWEYEIVTVRNDEDCFRLEVNGDIWNCGWGEVAWCIPMAALRLPEGVEEPSGAGGG